jgi:hypothetical protein
MDIALRAAGIYRRMELKDIGYEYYRCSLHTAHALVTCYRILISARLYNAGRRKERQAADFLIKDRKLQQVQQVGILKHILSLMKPRFFFIDEGKKSRQKQPNRKAMYVLSI